MTGRAGNPYLDFMLQNPVLFPWGSDEEREEDVALRRSRSPRKEFSGSRDGLVVQEDTGNLISWKLPSPTLLAGRILEHCQAVIHRVRLESGGLELAIYKIGITHECYARFDLYKAKGWDQMVIMHESPDLGSVEMLEATAKHVVSIAKTFVVEDSSKALQSMARCCKNDAEKALQKVLRQFDLTLDVPITQMTCASGVDVPVLLPQDFIRTLSDKGFLHKLLGGPVRNSGPRLQEFWERYRLSEPDHDIWLHSHIQEDTLVPLLVHGDGGRTYRKDELMVLQFQPSKPLTGCCFLCMAGTADFPFEEFTDSPKWIQTAGSKNPYPWEVLPPLLQSTPHNRSNPAALFRLDVLHVYHLGMGRDFVASSLVILLDVYEGSSVPECLDLMTADLRRFLAQTRRQLHFKVITRDLLGFQKESVFPVGHWSKASDTPILMEFLLWLLEQHRSKMEGDQLLRVIYGAADAMGVFMRGVLQAGLWLTTTEATAAYEAGMHFLRSYGKCASLAFRRHLTRYNLTPKLHCWHHICLDLKRSLDRGLQYHLSPLADANFADEDFVGRVSRLSRRVSPRLQGLRTIGRYLAATRSQLTAGQGD
ncbi:unnamed protein product [Symbiodinium sp. CCMP2592]|nr:unnamed protein product [Symbiodinium sp. CCMP2592]CAE7265423.1 unnamed protein product [Symbiodinium sp. CCMP2592]